MELTNEDKLLLTKELRDLAEFVDSGDIAIINAEVKYTVPRPNEEVNHNVVVEINYVSKEQPGEVK